MAKKYLEIFQVLDFYVDALVAKFINQLDKQLENLKDADKAAEEAEQRANLELKVLKGKSMDL